MDNITTSKQKERALDILTRSFHQSPGMTWFFRKRANRLKALRAFVNYCLVQASVYQGAFITSDRNGVVFFFPLRKTGMNSKLLFHRLRLILKVTGPRNAWRAFRLQKTIKRIRPNDGLCAWLLASDPDEDGCKAAYTVKKSIFEIADREQQIIYAETTNERMCRLYKSIGFEEYQRIDHPYTGEFIFFMKREPKLLNHES